MANTQIVNVRPAQASMYSQGLTAAGGRPDRFLPAYAMLSEEKPCARGVECPHESGLIKKNGWACFNLTATERYHRECFKCACEDHHELYAATERWGIKRLNPVYITETNSGPSLLYCSETCRQRGKPPECAKPNCNSLIELPMKEIGNFNGNKFHPRCFMCAACHKSAKDHENAKPGEVKELWQFDAFQGLLCETHKPVLNSPPRYSDDIAMTHTGIRGGFAEIYMADIPNPRSEENPKPLIKVVLRNIHKELTPHQFNTYKRELQIWHYLCTMDKGGNYILPLLYGYEPNEVPPSLYGTPILLPLAIAPYMENKTLADFVHVPGTNARCKLNSLKQAASALLWLHQLFICHGDIHGKNFLVSGGGEKVLLSDFGTTKFEGQLTSSYARGVGVMVFKAPERFKYERRSTKSDIYAFGIMVAQILKPRNEWEAWAEVPVSTFEEKVKNLPAGSNGRLGLFRPTPPNNYLEIKETWDIAEHCWAHDPQSRASLSAVIQEVEANIKRLQPPNTLHQDIVMAT